MSSLAFFGVNYGFSQLAPEGAASGLSLAQYAERALANGATGGVLASIQGQRFGSGFLSAGLSSTLNPAVDSITSNPYGQGFMAAVVGGTVSEATGGKFANGAITGVFAFAVGKIVSTPSKGGPLGPVSEGDYTNGGAPWDVDYSASRIPIAFSGQVSEDAIAMWVGEANTYYQSQRVNIENVFGSRG